MASTLIDAQALQAFVTPITSTPAWTEVPESFSLYAAADGTALAEGAARLIEQLLRDKSRAAPVHVALSGGSTPKKIYEWFAANHLYAKLASERSTAPFELWYGDVRVVPDDHPDSNAAMVLKALQDTVPAAALHPVDVTKPATEAAALYAKSLQTTLPQGPDAAGVPVFDVVMLGIGPDGHTASLFPGTAAAKEETALVTTCMPPEGTKPYLERVSMTTPVIQQARNVVLIAAGAEKGPVLRDLLAKEPTGEGLPLQQPPVCRLLRRCRGKVHLLLDVALAEAGLKTQE